MKQLTFKLQGISGDSWRPSANELKNKVLNICHKFDLHTRHCWVDEFDPPGTTVFVSLAESHIVVSHWPDRDAIYVDFFCCSSEDTRLFDNFRVAWTGCGMTATVTQVIERDADEN